MKFLLPVLFLALSACDSSDNANLNPQNPFGEGPAAVSLAPNGGTVTNGDMRAAGSYAILAKTGISNATGSSITGHIGVSPAAASYITGFTMTADASNVFSTAPEVIGGGKIYAADYTSPTPSNLTSAISGIETAYTNAAGRTPPDSIELGSGNLGGLTIAPGLYNWSSNVTIPTALTISGSATDVWIFQIAGNVTIAAATNIILAGGALPENIFWQVAGSVTIGTTAQFKGIILGKTAVVLQNLATLDGRIFSQTAVVLDDNAVTQP